MLERLGFTKNEESLYETLVLYGPLSIYELVKHTKLHTSVAYNTINRLTHKGFVSYIKIGRTKKFNATNPKALIVYNQETNKELMKKVAEWENKKAHNMETSVEFFEGLKGLTNLFNSILSDSKPNEDYLSFTLGDEFENKECLEWFNNLGRKREALKLKVKSLCSIKNKYLFMKVGNLKLLKKSGLKFSNFEFPQGIVIFRDFVIFISWNPVQAIKIKSEKISNDYRKFFLFLYNQEKNAL